MKKLESNKIRNLAQEKTKERDRKGTHTKTNCVCFGQHFQTSNSVMPPTPRGTEWTSQAGPNSRRRGVAGNRSVTAYPLSPPGAARWLLTRSGSSSTKTTKESSPEEDNSGERESRYQRESLPPGSGNCGSRRSRLVVVELAVSNAGRVIGLGLR